MHHCIHGYLVIIIYTRGRLSRMTVLDLLYHCSRDQNLNSESLLFHTCIVVDNTILIGPRLTSYTINMTSREVSLTFDQPIEPDRVDVTGITIQGRRYPGPAHESLFHSLTSGSSYRVEGTNMLKIFLSDADFDALQLRSLVATSQANTFLAMERRTVTDRSNLRIMAQQISSPNALQPSIYTGDNSPPEITSFTLDLDTNSMALTFSEPVLVSSFIPARLAINSQPSGGISYNLTGGTVHDILSPTSRVISFTLVDRDVTFLEMNPNIATGVGNTFLLASVGLIVDVNGDTNLQSQPILVSNFVVDTSGPRVVSFNLNMNTGYLTIRFNDPVDVSTLNPSGITLQSAVTRLPMEWHTLSRNSIAGHSTGFMVTLNFSNDLDFNQIKRIRNLCSTPDNCYMTATSSVIRGLNNINALPIHNGISLIVTNYTADTTRPELVRWELDMDRGRVVLTFTETVDITTFQPNQLTLQNGSDVFTPRISLSGFMELIPPDTNNILSIELNEDDLNSIKGTQNLGTSIDNSFLSVPDSIIVDMAFNPLVPVSNNSAQQATTFTPDTSSPVLLSFSLDLNMRMLILTFDEIVNTSSFDLSSLSLVNQESQSSIRYTFTAGYVPNINSAILRVFLDQNDVNAINALGYLASTQFDTYIVATMSTVQDTNNNPLMPISDASALRVAQYIGNTNSDRLIQLGFHNYSAREGETVRLRIFLNATAARDVTFSLVTRDRSAMGKLPY